MIADRAIQRVVDQQVFHDLLLVGDSLGALGIDDHAIAHGRLARGHQLGNAFDFHQTNAAGSDDRHARVIAVLRDMHARVVAGLQDHLAGLGVDQFSVNGNLGHRKGMVYGCPWKFHWITGDRGGMTKSEARKPNPNAETRSPRSMFKTRMPKRRHCGIRCPFVIWAFVIGAGFGFRVSSFRISSQQSSSVTMSTSLFIEGRENLYINPSKSVPNSPSRTVGVAIAREILVLWRTEANSTETIPDTRGHGDAV